MRDILIPIMLKNRFYGGVIDPLHSINLINICSKLEEIDLMKELLTKYKEIKYI